MAVCATDVLVMSDLWFVICIVIVIVFNKITPPPPKKKQKKTSLALIYKIGFETQNWNWREGGHIYDKYATTTKNYISI